MLTSKFLIFARPLSWDFFMSRTSKEDFAKPRLLVRVGMKLHNVCVDVRMEEEASAFNDYSGNYSTPTGRAQGRPRGAAEATPAMASGWAHPDGTWVPSWGAEDGTAAEAEQAATYDKSKDAQMTKVSKARQMMTDALEAKGTLRPDPIVVSQQIRAAKRRRHEGQ